jgi:hypothetical protein
VDAVYRSEVRYLTFAHGCTTNPAPTRYGRRMVQQRWTSRYLLTTLNLAVKVRWPVWITIGTLLAGAIPLLGVTLEHFRIKQVSEKFDS